MSMVQVLYPRTQLHGTLEVAHDRFGYLFHVTRPDGRRVDFVLENWIASDNTVRYLERKGNSVQVVPLAYEPDEDLLVALLDQAETP